MSLRLLPRKVEIGFFHLVRRVFNPELSSHLFEEAFCRFVKPRGTEVRVTNLTVPHSLAVDVSLDLGDYIQRSFYLYGYPHFMPDLLNFCDESTLFFDIGANVGLVSLGVATKIPQQNIFAFEPVAETFKRLLENTRANCPHIHLYQLALSDKAGEIKLATVGIDSGSASADFDYLKSRLSRNTPIHYERCATQAFDDVWSSLPFQAAQSLRIAVKIDVEGHEVAVLKGMQGFLAQSSHDVFVVCETHYHNIDEVLKLFEASRFERLSPPGPVLRSCESFGRAQDLVFRKSPVAAQSPV
jgi:FkbM family methyltransferase